MTPSEFAEQHTLISKALTPNETALRLAIANGTVAPDMTLRQIGEKAGIGANPQLVRHYLHKFMDEGKVQPKEKGGSMSKKNCMFQYARANRWTTDIYEDTGLITLEEAKELWRKHLPQFIKELQEEGERPEMVIWTDCESDTSYATKYAHVDEDTETDGVNLWNITRTKVELDALPEEQS